MAKKGQLPGWLLDELTASAARRAGGRCECCSVHQDERKLHLGELWPDEVRRPPPDEVLALCGLCMELLPRCRGPRDDRDRQRVIERLRGAWHRREMRRQQLELPLFGGE